MIYIFTSVILLAFICLMVFCIKILNENKALKLHVNILNKDHNSISEESLKLKEMLEIQDGMISEAIKKSIEGLN